MTDKMTLSLASYFLKPLYAKQDIDRRLLATLRTVYSVCTRCCSPDTLNITAKQLSGRQSFPANFRREQERFIQATNYVQSSKQINLYSEKVSSFCRVGLLKL
jgi:hypothetical protein